MCFLEEDNSVVLLPCMKAVVKEKLMQKSVNAFFVTLDNLKEFI